jgi:hypothetical protein
MKSLRYLILTTVCILGGFTGCNDDFLERVPLSKINDGLFWTTPNDLQVYMNNLYSKTELLPSYNSSTYSEIGPYLDDASSGSDIMVKVDYNKRMNAEFQLADASGWSTSNWEVLRDINYFLAHYKSVDAEFDKVARYVGEAYFFRATFYFTKLKRFGDVPWAPTLLDSDSPELFDGRTPRNELVDHLMDDLDLAIEYLPARGTGSWDGRINKEAALALQSRIALYEGTWEKYHALKNTPFRVQGGDNGQHFLEKAAEAAATLMEMSATNGYPGLDNVGQEDGYWNLFNQKDYSGSKEVLFWRQYSTEADQLYNRWVNISYTGAGTGITKRMIDQYLCTDGKPIYTATNVQNPLYKGDNTLLNVVTNRDPRLNQTICVPDDKHYRWKPDDWFQKPTITAELSTRCVTGYQLYKGHSADRAEYDAKKGTTAFIYFRYAEVLLNYAEAKAELGTISQDDIDKTVNALRRRVGMTEGLLDMNNITTDPNWLFKSTKAPLTPLLQEIRRERTVELAFEGFRVPDILRWAAADELIVGFRPKGAQMAQWPETNPSNYDYIYVDDEGYMDPYEQYETMKRGYRFNLERDYLYPIPTSELTLNPALRPQNPGW